MAVNQCQGQASVDPIFVMALASSMEIYKSILSSFFIVVLRSKVFRTFIKINGQLSAKLPITRSLGHKPFHPYIKFSFHQSLKYQVVWRVSIASLRYRSEKKWWRSTADINLELTWVMRGRSWLLLLLTSSPRSWRRRRTACGRWRRTCAPRGTCSRRVVTWASNEGSQWQRRRLLVSSYNVLNVKALISRRF